MRDQVRSCATYEAGHVDDTRQSNYLLGVLVLSLVCDGVFPTGVARCMPVSESRVIPVEYLDIELQQHQ